MRNQLRSWTQLEMRDLQKVMRYLIQPLFDGIFVVCCRMDDDEILFRCMWFFWMIFVLDGFIFRQVLFFRWIFLLGIFGLDVFFLYDFSNRPFGGDSFNDFVIGTTWIFRVFFWFVWTFRIIIFRSLVFSRHKSPPKKKIAEFIPHSEIASSCKFYRQFFV